MTLIHLLFTFIYKIFTSPFFSVDLTISATSADIYLSISYFFKISSSNFPRCSVIIRLWTKFISAKLSLLTSECVLILCLFSFPDLVCYCCFGLVCLDIDLSRTFFLRQSATLYVRIIVVNVYLLL